MSNIGGSSSSSSSPAPVADIVEVPVLTGVRNPRGIPQMIFLEDIGAFLQERKAGVDSLILSLTTMNSKYKLMESGMMENKRNLKLQIPDIESSLAAVKLLAEKRTNGEETFTVNYNLSEQVFSAAEVKPSGTVCLWLGANVMLEYTYEEAIELLTTNLANAVLKEQEVKEDIDYLKDQITTTEVNIARVYNYDVIKRREENRKKGVSTEVKDE